MQIKYIIAASAIATLLATGVSAAIIAPPPVPTLPTNASDCKKGGWENYNGLFKNQGDCVSFVATGGKNLPDGPNAPQ